MGLAALFAGASNTPIASTILGIELSGMESMYFIGIACAFSYLFSGGTGIYTSQIKGGFKHLIYDWLKSKRLRN
jgi:H+/Cl- antiporter ClcA